MDKQAPAKPIDLGATQEFVPAAQTQHVATPAQPAASAKPSGPQKISVLGDFRLLAKLGAGGMGTVYKAWQLSKSRHVALKVLSKELASHPGFIERFQREGQLMARLDHPHLIHYIALGASNGFYYLAMEFAAGGSIKTWLDKFGRFEVGDALHVALACAKALAYAHGLGLVHRDVKPDNLLLTADGTVKLADLGLAKTADDTQGLTRTGIAIGTPLYAAPEQITDAKKADYRCDLYAVGCVLYQLLTGKLPFAGDNFVELIKAKKEGSYTPVRRHVPDAPDTLDRILLRLLARLPELRYSGCDVLIDDLTCLGLDSLRLSFLPPAG
jgi:serine/threonine-protein kinase